MRTNYTGVVYGQTVTCNIPPGGGTCDLPGFASVIFPSGAFVTPAAFVPVTVSVTSDPVTNVDFEETRGDLRVPYEIRINSGNVGPATSFDVILDVPDTFISSLPPDQEIVIFAQIFGGEGEILDHFHDFDSTFDAVNKKANATLTFDAFTNQRNLERTYEAIVIVGALPLVPPAPATQSSSSTSPLASPTGPVCEGSPLGSPLLGELRPTSAFRSLRRPRHDGVDYNRTAEGTNVFAVAPGRVFWVDFERRVLPDGTVKGYGNYVIVKHDISGSMTLYGHLQDNSTDHLCGGIRPVPPEGCPLPADSVIGKVGRTGGADAPHLHLEYSPRGVAIKGKGGKFFLVSRFVKDPHPCIAPLQLSSPNPTLTCGTADPNVSFSATGAWPPYTWSTTKGTITPIGGSNATLTIRSGVVGVAYECCANPESDNPVCGTHAQDSFGTAFGCNDNALNNIGTIGCSDRGLNLPVNIVCCNAPGFAPCVNCSDFPYCNISITDYLTAHPGVGNCRDVRTAPMIAAGCWPCHLMQGATVTVRDSHPDPARRSSTDMAVTVR